MKTALYCAICLCALLWLTACSAVRPQIRTELIEIPVTAYAPLPAALTAPLPPPAPPPADCALPDGRATVCALAGLLWIEQWETLRQRANEDRATAARISRDAAQPAHSEPRLGGKVPRASADDVENKWKKTGLTTSDRGPAG